MARQLTEQEEQIIRQTKQEGEELARNQSRQPKAGIRSLKSAAIFMVVFVVFVFIAYMIFSSTGQN